MSNVKAKYRPGESRLVGMIADEDTITGFLLAGAGQQGDDKRGIGPNYFQINKSSTMADIEHAFRSLVARPDIAMILITQTVADSARWLIEQHTEPFPVVLEIPSKDEPFQPEKDTVLAKLNRLMGK